MKKSILKTMSLLLCTAMIMTMMLSQAALAATDYTCYIGSNGYSTLAEAVEAANPGDTIWMTANDSTTTNITVDKSVIIELEGYTLQNAMFTFTGDIDVALNDRKGEAKINTNHNSGNTIAVKNGASLTISGENYGTEIYGSENDSDKTIYVYANSHLTLNGGSILFAGVYMQDGIFLASKATLTINDCYVGRYNESNTRGGSLSLTSTPSEDYPVIIKKGRFKAGMWLGGTTSLSTIEEKVLATSEGSYIDYDKTVDGSSTEQWDIYIASKTLSTETEVENVVDAQNTLRVTTGGNISVKAGNSIVFEPKVSGGTQDEITYTWTKDGENTGVTTDTFVIEATTSDDAGEYVFTATQGNNSVSCTYVLSVQAENHSHHDISFDKWSEMTDLPIMSGNYYLENEVALSAIWTVPQGVTNLCINGRVIDLNSYYINVPAGAALNIYTCEDLKQYYDVSDNLWIPVGGFTDENKERYTSGGVITGGSNSAIFVNGGSLTLNGGAIAGNTGNAGGVTLMNGATFTMNGGDIVGNSSKGDAGGVMNNNSTFTINGGRIHNNYAANNGGGVFNVYENALFTMNGGKIYDNISSVGAGGIGNYEDAEMIVTGGSISGNSTTWGGGGIFNYHSTLTLMGGVIDNNSSTWGGGAVLNEGILHISGAPVIKDNFVNETPNNIYLLYPEFPIVVDGPISSGPIPVSVYPDEGQLDDDFKFTESTDVSLNDASNFEYEYEGYHIEKKDDGQLYVVADSTEVESKLFSTTSDSDLLSKAVDGKLFADKDYVYGVVFTDLNEHDLTDVTTLDYSADGDGSVLAWRFEDDLYIGGYGKIIAGDSLAYAFYYGSNINSIKGLELLDTSNVTDMSYMFYDCGNDSSGFTLDLGENFDTSNVTDMSYMFAYCGGFNSFTLDLGEKFDTHCVETMNFMFSSCGYNSSSFTLGLGDKFDTSNVTNMSAMFEDCGYGSSSFTLDLGDKFNTSKVKNMTKMFNYCGAKSEAFDVLDLSSFTISSETTLTAFASGIPVSKIIFGDGWKNANLPEAGKPYQSAFYASDVIDTTIVNASDNLFAYNWSADNRMATYEGNLPVVNEYTITANATDGGVAEGTATVEEGQSVTLTATANEGYKFIGWFDGDTKICETEEFTVENVTSDKTYTAKFELIEIDEPIEPSGFDFDSIRTGNGQNISVDHENRKISVDVEEGDNLVLYVHQKDIIPGGQIRMNSYNGYKVKYDASGVYRIYTIDDTSVTVSTKVTIDGVTEIYDLQVNYKELNSEFDFEKISCENGETFEIDHDARTIRIYAEKDAEYVTLYKDQSEFVNGKLILTSFMGNRVQSNQADGTYKVCFVKNKEVSVKGNISIGGVTKEYTIISVFSLDWGFDSLKAENATITAIDHTAKTVTMKASDSSVQLFIDQTDLKGNAQVWMKSYNGNKVKYNANDRTYTITQGTSESLTVSIKVTIYGETRYYDLILNF